MARAIAAGTWLNAFAGSLFSKPDFQVLVWNHHRVRINDVAAGTVAEPPLDLTHFCTRVSLSENSGFENGEDPSVTHASLSFVRSTSQGVQLRPGLLADGVIVQIRKGDRRIHQSDWVTVFTGQFRGRPGDDPGTRDDRSEGMTAVAYGREASFLERTVSTESHTGPIDLGVIAHDIARRHMGLGQDEIRFGTLGFESRHLVNQIVESKALAALWHLMFPAGKKPKFNALGQLVAVDADLDKPAVRILSAGDAMVRSRRAAPNEIEVHNSVVLRGQAHDLSKALQELQQLTEVMPTIGFFEARFKEDLQYSEDRTQRAEETQLVTKTRIPWSDADWTEKDEFHGTLEIDTHYLRNVRAIIFASWLAIQIYIAIIDLFFHEGGAVASIANLFGAGSIAALRFVLQILSLITMALLLWSMNFIGRGRYQIHGKPFEFVYQELVCRYQLRGLEAHQVREAEYRNDFISTMGQLSARARALLKRELVKNQLHEIELVDDPALEVDDVIETSDGSRFYIQTIEREYQRGGRHTMRLVAWKVFDGALARVLGAHLAQAEAGA